MYMYSTIHVHVQYNTCTVHVVASLFVMLTNQNNEDYHYGAI